MSRFFTKQKDGDAPAALEGQKTLDVTALPYMRNEAFGQVIEKRGEFRETSQQSGGEQFVVSGFTKDGGVISDNFGLSSLSYKAPFHTSNKLYFGPTTPPDADASKLMWYLGRNTYLYIKTTDTSVITQDYPGSIGEGTSLQSLPIIQCSQILGVVNGRRSNPDITQQIDDIYCSIFDPLGGYLGNNGRNIPNNLQDSPGVGSLVVQPLDEAGDGGVTALIYWSTFLGVTDREGMIKSDMVYAKMTKAGLGPISVIPRLAPGSENWPNAGWARWQIFTVTPLIWVAFSGVYVDSFEGPPVFDYGGYVIFYRTNDGGVTWNLTQDANNLFSDGAFNFNFPRQIPPAVNHNVPPWIAPEDAPGQRNGAVQTAATTMQLCVITPTIWIASYVYFGFGSAPSISDFGVDWEWMIDGLPHCVFQSRLLRTTDGGNNWTAITAPALIETQLLWPTDSLQCYVFRDMTYCGNGVVIAKIRAGTRDYFDTALFPAFPDRGGGAPLTWNLARSMDYGVTWACVPKNGIPAAPGSDARYIGRFCVVKKATGNPAGGQNPATILMTCWEDATSAYYVYVSRDNGDSWNKGALITKSDEFQPMDIVGYGNFGPVQSQQESWRFLEYTGDDVNPAPVSMVQPWRFNSKINWVPE